MKISFLAGNLSANSLGRVYLLAKLLKPYYEVEIIGSVFGSTIWPPCDTEEINYKPFPGMNYPRYVKTINNIIGSISGEVIYACKSFPGTLGAALIAKSLTGKPVILDVDDWDSAIVKEKTDHPVRYGLRNILNPKSYFHVLFLEKLSWLVDDITVSSTFLADKFGGTIIRHVRNTEFLDPANFKREVLRDQWGVSRIKLIVFFGTVRPHKGLEDLIQAIQLLDRKDIVLWLVGADTNSPFVQRIIAQGEDFIKVFGYQPMTQIPVFLSMADLIVIPQRQTPYALAQVPAKLFDAMAMAKPIVGTAVSDIPEILDGCGLTVEPENIGELAHNIERVLSNYAEAEEMGRKARQKCQRLYSWTAARRILRRIIDKHQ